MSDPIAPSNPPVPGFANDPARELPPTVTYPQPCIQCGYNLVGLATTANCPECGTPVERSMRGDLLRFASPDYQAALHRGVFLVQASIVTVFLSIAGVIAFNLLIGLWTACRSGATGPTTTSMRLSTDGSLYAMLSLVPAAISIWGWWLLSSADPGQVSTNKGETPRRLIRIAVATTGAVSLLNVVLELLAAAGGPTAGQGPLYFIARIGGIVSLVAWVVQFIASMLYIKWLAPRLPSRRIHKRSKLMLWLGPLLFTVGSIACGVGAIIAICMYYNLLEWLRLDIKAIRRGRAARLE